MKNIIWFSVIISLLAACRSDDNLPLECQERQNLKLNGQIMINNTLPFNFVNQNLFATHENGLIFQKEGVTFAHSDTLIFYDVDSKEKVWSYNAEDYVQVRLFYLKDGVLYWNFLDIRSIDLNTLEEKVIVDDSEVNIGEYFSINYNHILYTTFDGGSAEGFSQLWRKNLMTGQDELVFTDSLVKSAGIQKHILHPIEWENEVGERYISFLTRFNDDFPITSYNFYTIKIEDFSVLVKKPLLNYGSVKSTPFTRKGNFIYEFSDGSIGNDDPLIAIDGMTADLIWSLSGDISNIQQLDNDNENLGRYLLISVGVDLVLIDTDTGTEVYNLNRQGSISSSSYDNNTIILNDGKTVFYGFGGTFYGYNIESDCKILELSADSFPEPYEAYSFDFANNQFVFKGQTKIMFYANK